KRIAGVEREANSVLDLERWPAAPVHRAVLDVVMNEESGVEQFQRHRERERLVDAAAEGPAGGEAQRRAQCLRRAPRIGVEEVVQVASRLTGGEPAE